jgi:hypothetical protein
MKLKNQVVYEMHIVQNLALFDFEDKVQQYDHDQLKLNRVNSFQLSKKNQSKDIKATKKSILHNHLDEGFEEVEYGSIKFSLLDYLL